MRKVYLLIMVLVSSTICNAGGDYSAQIQSLKVEINRLNQEKETKTKQLEQCQDKLKGLKIGGITTLGLTGIGIGANIGEAVAISGQNKEKDKLATQLKEKIPLSDSIGNVNCDDETSDNSKSAENTILSNLSIPSNQCEMIYFQVNKSSIDSTGLMNEVQAKQELNDICSKKPTQIVIFGHCSTTASSPYNQKLSSDRAENTYKYLKDIDGCREGSKETYPVVYTKYYLGESGKVLQFSDEPSSTNSQEDDQEDRRYRYARVCYLTDGNI